MSKDSLRGRQRVRTARGRTAQSTRWLERQLNDPYVRRAKAEGYRSRAAYKLIELDEKFGFLKAAHAVVDLGIVRAVTPGLVTITPTYTGCPATQVIERDIRDRGVEHLHEGRDRDDRDDHPRIVLPRRRSGGGPLMARRGRGHISGP